MTHITLIALGIFCGVIIHRSIIRMKERKKEIERKKECIEAFSILIGNLVDNNIQFKSKNDNLVFLTTILPKYNDVNILYDIKENTISILKSTSSEYNVIFTSKDIQKETTDRIIKYINISFKNEINGNKKKKISPTFDLGSMLAGLDLDKMMNDLISGSTNSFSFSFDPTTGNMQDLGIKEQPKTKIVLEMDAILDRINEIGYDKLTPEEKEFLKNQNKN